MNLWLEAFKIWSRRDAKTCQVDCANLPHELTFFGFNKHILWSAENVSWPTTRYVVHTTPCEDRRTCCMVLNVIERSRHRSIDQVFERGIEGKGQGARDQCACRRGAD